MIRSMTGFATRVVTVHLDEDTRAHLAISLKSLNSRFFEATCRLPYQLSLLETSLIKHLSKKLHRGHVYLTIHVDNQVLFKGTVSPSLMIVKGYLDAAESIKQKYAIAGSVTMQDLLQLPNVFSLEEVMLDDTTKELITTTIDALAQELINAQEHEGSLLAEDITKRSSIMAELMDKIEAASRQLLQAHKAKIMQTWPPNGADEAKTVDMQKQAAYALLDKMDIHEEVIRFKTHLASLKNQVISADVEKGKRLDFTLQELMREINTITAKCSDASIGAMAIDIKVELEKAREQAQNIV